MNFILLTVSLICFNGPGPDCIPVGGGNMVANVVYECPTVGDSTIPLQINSAEPGRNNPGDGMVFIYQKDPDEDAVLLKTLRFTSRGAFGNNANYSFVEEIGGVFDDIFILGFEGCTCHASSPLAAEGCPDYLPPPDPPIP